MEDLERAEALFDRMCKNLHEQMCEDDRKCNQQFVSPEDFFLIKKFMFFKGIRGVKYFQLPKYRDFGIQMIINETKSESEYPSQFVEIIGGDTHVLDHHTWMRKKVWRRGWTDNLGSSVAEIKEVKWDNQRFLR